MCFFKKKWRRRHQQCAGQHTRSQDVWPATCSQEDRDDVQTLQKITPYDTLKKCQRGRRGAGEAGNLPINFLAFHRAVLRYFAASTRDQARQRISARPTFVALLFESLALSGVPLDHDGAGEHHAKHFAVPSS